jgi:hypothetical protein
MGKLIAFSGACHSGKTSAIRDIKEHFGDRILVVNEVIRQKAITNIDKIRSNPKAYLEFQFEVIREKFTAEQSIIQQNPNAVVLTDRSLADSFFYYVFYVDKSTLSRELLERYTDFFKWLYFRTLTSARCYDHIFLFRPLKLSEEDLLRPGNLDLLQDVEFFFIKTLVLGFYSQSNVTEISTDNETDINTLYSFINAYLTKA